MRALTGLEVEALTAAVAQERAPILITEDHPWWDTAWALLAAGLVVRGQTRAFATEEGHRALRVHAAYLASIA